MKAVLKVFVKLYQIVGAPIFMQFGGRCKFHPSCSHYAAEALKVHGPVKGAWLSAVRVAKCGPFTDGGFDPVPVKKDLKNEKVI